MKENININEDKKYIHSYFKINLYGTFGGTEHYYKQPFSKIVLTDGAYYVSANGCGWLIAEIIYNKDIIKNEFVSITFKAKNHKGVLTWIGDDEEKHSKIIEYTDFVGEVKFYLTDNVLMLISEY